MPKTKTSLGLSGWLGSPSFVVILCCSDGQTDTTTTDQSASPAYSSPGIVSTQTLQKYLRLPINTKYEKMICTL